jgi:hypothetical protein
VHAFLFKIVFFKQNHHFVFDKTFNCKDQKQELSTFKNKEQKLLTSKSKNKKFQPSKIKIRIFNLQQQTKTFNLQVLNK